MEAERKSSLFFIQNDEPPTARSFSLDSSNGFRPCIKKKKNKTTGVMQLIRAALFMINNKSSKKSSSSNNSFVKWKKLLGLVRPLQLESHQLPPPSSPPALRRIQASSAVVAQGDREVAPPSPAAMSQYASANSLADLEEEEEEEEEHGDCYYDGVEGDEMIDSKAEEFIARFYHQMRLQDQRPN
ncbi:unnamed protein product [Linum trigynum]|uniref:Uncharacterized protein n=1 Tax=Linum trigynum TaxID=586398 RepID=A0AAV2FKE0_9ROSI